MINAITQGNETVSTFANVLAFFPTADSHERKFSLLISVLKNVKAFFGRNIDCTEMTIAIDYSDSRFEKVAISYVNAKSSVEIVYLFD